MFGDRFSSSTSCSRWLHETEPGRLDQSLSCRFLKVATHPLKALKGEGWQALVVWECEVKDGALIERRLWNFLGK